MAGLTAKPPRLLLVHPDDSSTDTDSDDLSLCDLPIRAPSAPSAATGGSNLGNGRVVSIPVDDQPSRVDDDEEEDNDPFEFFGTRVYGGHDMCSPPSVFSGGSMFPTPASRASSTSSLIPSPRFAKAADANVNPNPRSTSYEPYSWSSSHPSPASPPPPMSRRSRSEAVRRPPRDVAAVYNRSASVEGRGRARSSGLGPAGRKGDYYRRLPPLQPAPQAASSPSRSSGSHSRKASGSGGMVTTSTSSIDPVPTCGPRPKWYVFATFATVKPPQAEMDIKGIRTRQKKRNTQQQPADGAGAAAGGSYGGSQLPTFRRLASEVRRGPNKSWGLLSSLSCRVDVDTLAWSPSSDPPPLPLP